MLSDKYVCPKCNYSEVVTGVDDDKQVKVTSKVIGVIAYFKNARVRDLAYAEIRHVLQGKCK
jgi:hypothetical protein